MAVVQETENLEKAPAASVVAPRPAEGTGEPKLLDRLREALRPGLTPVARDESK